MHQFRLGHSRWRALVPAGPVLAGSLAAVALAGCGSSPAASGVASLSSSATPSASAKAAAKVAPTAYSACMRSHGVPAFPDPDSQGHLTIDAQPGTGLDPESAVWKAAEKTCRALQPQAGKPNAAQQQKALTAALAYSACMRSHGVTAFPDPVVSDGGLKMSMTKEIADNPHYASAQQACQKLQQVPGGGGPDGGPGLTTGGLGTGS